MSGLMFADGVMGISETPGGLPKQIEIALEHTRKWRVTTNVSKNAVLVCVMKMRKSRQMELGSTGIVDR